MFDQVRTLKAAIENTRSIVSEIREAVKQMILESQDTREGEAMNVIIIRL